MSEAQIGIKIKRTGVPSSSDFGIPKPRSTDDEINARVSGTH
jgi:hypothetical protein